MLQEITKNFLVIQNSNIILKLAGFAEAFRSTLISGAVASNGISQSENVFVSREFGLRRTIVNDPLTALTSWYVVVENVSKKRRSKIDLLLQK